MNKSRNPALIELIIVIFFFSLSASVIVQLFMASHSFSVQSEIAGNVLIMSQDWLEQLKSDPDKTDEILSDWIKSSDTGQMIYSQYFSDNMDVCSESEATLLGVITISESDLNNGNLISLSVTVSDLNGEEGDAITTLNTQIYVSSGAEVVQ